MDLRDVAIKTDYSSDDEEDLVDSFYNPVLSCAKTYDRLTGYFSPKVLAVAARGFRCALKNNCKFRILTSASVDNEIYDAITSDTKLDELGDFVEDFSIDTLRDELDVEYLKLFMLLYKSGQLELKIAITRSEHGIFHQKIGNIKDGEGNLISFDGSINETAAGWVQNIEQFKVYKSWEEGDSKFLIPNFEKFDKFWQNEAKKFKVLDIDEAAKRKLIERANVEQLDLKDVVSSISRKEHPEIFGVVAEKETRQLRPYQEDAICHWVDSSYVGIFEMATGTGKTFTTVSALERFRGEKGFLHCVVGVPLISLLTQWSHDIKETFGQEVEIITASSQLDNRWREKIQHIRYGALLGSNRDYVIIVPYVTFASDEFRGIVDNLKGDNLLFVADEMHNLVTERCLRALNVEIFPYRLGLSATPVRLWKPNESQAMIDFFGDNPYVFTLERAIKEKFLVPYYYDMIFVELTPDEWVEYLNLSKKIARQMIIKQNDDYTEDVTKELLLKRSRIKKNAYNKIAALKKLMRNIRNQKGIYYSLIYTDDKSSVEKTQLALNELEIITSKFTGDEAYDERERIIEALREKRINAILAIKCLDEGVDIPSARNAFFMSSNTDPREYIQRLGRVLRLDRKSHKDVAHIYDFIVTPPNDGEYGELDTESDDFKARRRLMRSEFTRASFFETMALDGDEIYEKINDKALEMGIVFTDDELEIKETTNGAIE